MCTFFAASRCCTKVSGAIYDQNMLSEQISCHLAVRPLSHVRHSQLLFDAPSRRIECGTSWFDHHHPRVLETRAQQMDRLFTRDVTPITHTNVHLICNLLRPSSCPTVNSAALPPLYHDITTFSWRVCHLWAGPIVSSLSSCGLRRCSGGGGGANSWRGCVNNNPKNLIATPAGQSAHHCGWKRQCAATMNLWSR